MTSIDRGVLHADSNEPALLTVRELAALLNCEPKTVEDAARSGRLPGFKYERSWVFPRTAVVQALHEEAMRNLMPRQPRIRPQPLAALVGKTPEQVRARPGRRTPLPTLIDFRDIEPRVQATEGPAQRSVASMPDSSPLRDGLPVPVRRHVRQHSQHTPMNPISRVRERLGVTQETLAEGIGCTQGNIGHYERGQSIPPARARRLIAFAAACGHVVTFDDIYAEPNDTPHERDTR